MASSKARQMDMFLNGLHDSSGQPLKAYKVYFWTNSGASTEKIVWADIDKTTLIDQSSGITLGNKGELDVYGDGEYYVQVKTPAGVLHDSFTISYSSTVDFGGLYIDVGADFGTTGTNIQEALDSLNSLVNYTFLFKDADFVVGQDITFPSNVLIKGMITATINQTSGTLTINRTPDLPEFQFFTGTPSITWGSAVQHVKPIWTEGDASISSISYYKGIKYNTVSKTETYTASDESVILVDASSGAVTINLPAASGLSGREYTIKKTDSSVNAVTIDGNASETIDGETTRIIYSQYASLTVICNGTNWLVVKSLDETKDIIITNTAPVLTLSDTDSGTSQTQSINFKTADGQYASINGNTTGAGIGNINFDANKLSFLDRRHLYTYDKTLSASTTTDIIKIQSTSSGFHGAIVTVSSVRKSGSGSVYSARKTFALHLYSGNVIVTSTIDNIPQNSTFFNTIGTSISGGELTFTLNIAQANTMTLILDIDSYTPMTITNL